jgi:hypothetical protein
VRERRIRIVSVKQRAAGPRRGAVRVPDDDRRRARRRELRQVSGIRDERQVPRLRLYDAGDANDLEVAVAVEAALQPLRDVS